MSAVLEREVSEGFPIDGRVFEPPQVDTNNEAPRYLAFMGSLIEPQTAKDRPWTKGGGIEVTNPCLRFVKNFIRKGRITPLLKDTHNFIPYDVAKKIVDGDPTQHGYFRQGIPSGYKPPNLPPSRGVGYGTDPSPVGTLVGKVAYPGDQINGILTGTANIASEGYRRGIVEITSLTGKPYKASQLEGGMYVDADIWEIQRAIFPDYPFFYNQEHQPTVLLDDIERILDDATRHSSLREIIDDFLRSLTDFRDYASTTIQNAHAKMREIAAKTEGYIPRYTAMDLVLLGQLGMERQDREIRKSIATPATDTELRDVLKQFIALTVEEKLANKAREERLAEAPVDANTMAAAPIEGYSGYGGQSGFSGFSGELTNATPEGQEHIAVAMSGVERYDCDCGWVNEKNTPQGLSLHQRRYCELTKLEN